MTRALGMNMSQTVDGSLVKKVRRRYWELWNERNKQVVEAYDARVTKHGLPLVKYRGFGKGLGDGRM